MPSFSICGESRDGRDVKGGGGVSEASIPVFVRLKEIVQIAAIP